MRSISTCSKTNLKCKLLVVLLIFLTTNTICQTQTEQQSTKEKDDGRIWTSGELKGLNSLIKKNQIEIADVYLNKTLVWPLPTISLTASDIVCANFSIGSLAVKSLSNNSTYVELGLMAADVDVDCSLSFDVATEGSFEIEGSGDGKVFTEGNSIEISMGFTSDDFSKYPPSNATIDACAINIKVKTLEIETSMPLIDNFMEQFKPLIETELQNMVSKTGCGKLREQVEKNVPPLLNQMSDFVESSKQGDGTENKGMINQSLNSVNNLPEAVFNMTDTSKDNPSAWFIVLLNRLSPLLSFPVNDPFTGESDLAINVVLRSLSAASVSDGGLSLPFANPITVYQLNNSFVVGALSIKSATIEGFDSFEIFSPFNITGPYKLRNDFKLDKILIDLDFELQFQPFDNETTSSLLIQHNKQPNINVNQKTSFQALVVDVPEGTTETYKFSFTISGGVKDLDLSVGTLLALAMDKMTEIDLACLSFTQEILPCFLNPVLKFSFLQTKFHTTPQVVQPTLSNSSNRDIQSMLNPAFQSLHYMYGDLLEDAIPALLDTQMRRAINPWINNAISDYQSNNVHQEHYFKESIFIDYRDLFLPSNQALEYGASGTLPYGDLLPIIKGYLDTFLESSNSTVSGIINDYLITPYTQSQSGSPGVMRFPNSDDPYKPFFSVSSNIDTGGLQASIVFHSPQLRITNVDSFTYPFKLIQPTRENAYTIGNVATMGPPDAPLRISLPIYTSFKTPDAERENYMEVSLELHMIQLIFDVLAKINATAFFGLTLDEIYANPCEILATIPHVNNQSDYYPTFSIPQILFSVQEAKLDLKCITCTNPEYWDDFISLLKTPEGINDSTEIVNNLSDFVLRTLFRDNGNRNIFQSSMDEVLKNATNLCDEGSMFDFASVNLLEPAAEQDIDYFDSSSGQIMYIALSLLVLVAFILCIMLLMRYVIHRSYKEWFEFFATPQQIMQLQREEIQRNEIDKYLNLVSESMTKSDCVPIFLKIGMPIIFVLNMALFLSGHLNLGASVSISIEFGGEQIARIDNFYSFWLGRSIVDIWEAGAKALAALMCIFSVIWPYTKQIINLFLWCSPTKSISIKTRGSVLHWVDILGKWSMVDIFVIVMSLVGFWIAIDSPQNFAFLPKDLYAIKLYVKPVWGLYANLTAQLLSQITSHLFIHYHRRVEDDGMMVLQMGTEEETKAVATIQEETLKDYVYHTKNKEEGNSVQVHGIIDYLFILLIITAMILIIMGNVFPSFQLDILGIIGLLVELKSGFQDEAMTKHSVFTVASLLWEEAKFLDTTNDYIGLFTLITVIVSTSFIVPLVLLLIVLWLWFGSMTKTSRTKTLFAIEVLQAWQYVEVYIVSVLVTIWQLGDVSGFLVNESCSALDNTFSLLVFLDVIKKEDAQCLYVQANILSGLFMLLTGAFILAFVSRFIIIAAKQRDQIDVDAKNQKIDLSKIRLEYDEEDPATELEAQSQSVKDGNPSEIPKPAIPIPVSEEYPCFFSYVDAEEIAAEQAPTRMILSYDGNVNSIEIAYDKNNASKQPNVSKKNEMVTYDRNSPKRKNSVSKVPTNGKRDEKKEYFNSLNSVK